MTVSSGSRVTSFSARDYASVICILQFLTCMFAFPALAQPSPAPGYFDILAIYRSGEFDRAIAAIEHLAPPDLAAVPQALATAGVERLRAAALLHLEVAMSARLRHDPFGWTRHAGIGNGAVARLERLDRHDAFGPAWRLLVIAFLEREGDLLNAVLAADEARKAGGDTPLLMLSVGAAHEMSWTWKADGAAESPLKGRLNTALSLYKQALALDPTLLEARVRLGRVLTLRGDIGEALTTLAGVSEQGERGYAYLARLFEGDALERQGDFAAAQGAYERATHLMPHAQSARLAASQLRHANGRRADAAERILATMADRKEVETADAWYWYTRGMAWRVDPYLSSLRNLVTGK